MVLQYNVVQPRVTFNTGADSVLRSPGTYPIDSTPIYGLRQYWFQKKGHCSAGSSSSSGINQAPVWAGQQLSGFFVIIESTSWYHQLNDAANSATRQQLDGRGLVSASCHHRRPSDFSTRACGCPITSGASTAPR